MAGAPAGTGGARLLRWLLPGAAAVLFAVLLTVDYARVWPVSFDRDRVLGPVTTGFYPRERNDTLTWTWTGPHAEVRLDGLDRRVDWRFAISASVWRPPGVPMPHVRVSVDGIVLADEAVVGDNQRVDATIPRRPGASDVRIAIDVDPPFVPSADDTRQLGVAVTSMTLEPAARPLPPWPALVSGSLAIALFVAGLLVVGVPASTVLALAAFSAMAQAWIVTRDFAVYSAYVWTVVWVSGGLAVGASAVARLVERWRGVPTSALGRAAVGVSVTACFLKLLVLLHPSMPIGDVLFHAHRFESVLRGDLFFTSVAPGSFAFPYPILLYVVSAPWSVVTSDTVGRMALLRIVVTTTDAAAAMTVYWLVVRTIADARVGLGAVVWYHLLPVTGWIMTWGNLTNAFAQPLAVAALAMVVALPVDRANRRTVVALTVVATAALLAHPSTSAILVTVMLATAVLYRARGGAELRGAAWGVGAAAVAATIASIVLYYGWFVGTYVSELPRVAAEAGARGNEVESAVLPLASIPRDTLRFFGWPALVAAAMGLWRLSATRVPRRLALLFAAWLGACAFYLVVGVLTPVTLRAHFAALPVVAVLASLAVVSAWSSRWPVRAGAVVLMAAALWVGIDRWMFLLIE